MRVILATIKWQLNMKSFNNEVSNGLC